MAESSEGRITYREATRLMYGEGKKAAANFRQYRRRRKIPSFKNPNSRREEMVRVADLPESAQERLRRNQLKDSTLPRPDAPRQTAPPQGQGGESPEAAQQEFFPQTPADRVIDEARKLLTPSEFSVAMKRFKIVQPLANHDFMATDFKQTGFKRRGEYRRAMAKMVGVVGRSVQRWTTKFDKTLELAGPVAAFCSLANERPGPERGTKSLDSSMKGFLLGCWIERKLTRKQCCRALRAYLEEKQRGTGARWAYEIPSDSTICRFINAPEPYGLGGDQNPLRGGPEIVKAAAGYIDRRYDDQLAGDSWCMDEFELDCYPYEDSNHRIVYNYGRKNPWGEPSPVLHLLSIIDERTTFIPDWILTIRIDDDTLTLAERTLRNYWTPLRLVSDRASRFRQLSYGHMRLRSMRELQESLDGPLGQLGVVPRGSREKNPRANRIERMHHIYADMARRDFSGHGWRPPKKVKGFPGQDLRQATAVDQMVQEHWRYHCGRAKNSPRAGEPSRLLALSEVGRLVAGWIEEINNCETDAKGCSGMTRLAAFRHFSPAPDEIAQRRASQHALDEAFAERATKTVLPGGIVEMPGGLRYDSRELLMMAGEEVEISRLRRDHSQIFIEANGAVIVANLRRAVGVRDEDILAAEAAELARRRKLLGGAAPRLQAAGQSAEEHVSTGSVSPGEQATAREKLKAPRTMTSGELARRALELQAGPDTGEETTEPTAEGHVSIGDITSAEWIMDRRKLRAPRTPTAEELADEVFGKGRF